jgi:hypothetical protein
MPRQARIDAPGAVHHVIVRGIERRTIFLDDQDRSNWIARLEKILTENRTPCFAWAGHLHRRACQTREPFPPLRQPVHPARRKTDF